MAYALTPDRNGAFVRSHADERDIRREIEFRRARRHSGRVRALRIALPLLAAVILSLYALPSLLKRTIDNGRGTATVRAIAVEAGSLKMIEPHVKGVNEQGEAYDFLADTATQAAKDANVMYLEVVRGKMTSLDGKISTLTAPNGVHDNKAEQITFNNGAFVTRDGGMSATFKTATAYMKQQMVVSKTPVIVRLRESTINADNVTLWWSDQRAVFEGKVRTHIERQQEVPAAAQDISNAQGGAPAN
jgi:lipopolysaccharide export system protein LptC